EMDILVGKIAGVALPALGGRSEVPGTVEGSVLAVRRPRGGRGQAGARGQASEERRRRRSATRVDPPGARVLTLLITDPSAIPADAETGSYRVVVRFIREA